MCMCLLTIYTHVCVFTFRFIHITCMCLILIYTHDITSVCLLLIYTHVCLLLVLYTLCLDLYTQGRRLRYGCNGFGCTTFQKSISGKDRYPVKYRRDRLLCHSRIVIRVFRWLLLVKNLFYLIYLQFLTIL